VTVAEVILDISIRELGLMIHDNGTGFFIDHVQSDERFGLQDLKEREALVGVKLDVESLPGGGTTIHFSWARF
jgi:signal transduction histidine kinase